MRKPKPLANILPNPSLRPGSGGRTIRNQAIQIDRGRDQVPAEGESAGRKSKRVTASRRASARCRPREDELFGCYDCGEYHNVFPASAGMNRRSRTMDSPGNHPMRAERVCFRREATAHPAFLRPRYPVL